MKFLVDECLHTSLVALALDRGHEASHVAWLGLGLAGEADWDLMKLVVADDLTFVTNNARDFRRLFAREPLHAGLVIIVPQVVPAHQRELFAIVLDELADSRGAVNEVIEIELAGLRPFRLTAERTRGSRSSSKFHNPSYANEISKYLAVAWLPSAP